MHLLSPVPARSYRSSPPAAFKLQCPHPGSPSFPSGRVTLAFSSNTGLTGQEVQHPAPLLQRCGHPGLNTWYLLITPLKHTARFVQQATCGPTNCVGSIPDYIVLTRQPVVPVVHPHARCWMAKYATSVPQLMQC